MKKKSCSSRYCVIAVLFGVVLLPGRLFAADLTVPELELISRGRKSGDTVILETRGRSEILLSGGYKFGGSLLLGFESGDLNLATNDPPMWSDYGGDNGAFNTALSNYLDNQTTLQFQGAEITYRSLFNSNTDLTYFVGRAARLASAEVFPSVFGSMPIATKYQGYLYFPDFEYRGIHTVNGTGIGLSSSFGSEGHRGSLYFYQDGYLGEGYYSVDAQYLMNFEKIKLELFAGGSFPQGSLGLYRGGLLFYYRPTERGEFFSQIGVPYYKPFEEFNINNLYFLFEPRIHFDLVSVILTLFWHPGYYLMETTGEEGSADIHFNLQFGNPHKNPITGGIETNFNLNTATGSTQDFHITTSPYLSAVTSGVVWDFMVNLTLLPYSLEDMVEGVIGVRAEF